MNVRTRTLAIAFAVAAAACSQDKSGVSAPPPAAPYVGITASASTVVANGSNSVTLAVTNTGGGSVTVTTTRGTFASTSSATATVSGASSTLVLLTCNAATAGCVGNAIVTASGSAGTASVTIAFGSMAATCQTNCAADPGCVGLACNLSGGGTGACSSGTPSTCVTGTACTPSAATETSCSDGIDNDCNGTKDCADSACDNQPCSATSATSICKSGKCTDIASGLAVTVTPKLDRLPAQAGAQTEVDVTVTSDTDPAPNFIVTVSVAPGALGTILPASAQTDANGVAKFTFTASGSAGAATITAALQAIPQVKGIAVVTMPKLGSLRLLDGGPGSVQFAVMGAKYSGFQDFGWIAVEALDDVGLPYPDGLEVDFQHLTLGGSALRGPLTTVAGCAPPLCDFFKGVVDSGTTPNTTGRATAWIYSGTVAGTLAVQASATAAGVTSTVNLPTIAVVGAKASGANFSLVCSPRNVPALAETTGGVSLVDAPVSCEALLKDRFNNVLGRSTQVIMMAEAGALGQPTWTKDYDPTAPGDGQMDLGAAVNGLNTLGAGLPFDVAPVAGEPSWTELDPFLGTTIVHNPRDGVVTIIAIADGEEMFFDANGNGTYDVGEPFIDLGEPFVDVNDNGQYDLGEPFLDVDGNGVWTPPNGKWDANTKIWTQTIIVYSGTADMVVLPGPLLLGTRIADDTLTDACTPSAPPGSFDVFADSTTHPGGTTWGFGYVGVGSDRNLNRLNTNTTYGADAILDGANVKVSYFGLTKYADLPGMDFVYWPCDVNGTCASQCRATAGGGRCHLVPLLGNYTCGITAPMLVTGVKAGGAILEWKLDVPWSEYKNGYVQHGGDTVSGIIRP